MHIAEHFLEQNLVLTVSGRLNLYSRKIFQAVMKNAESSNIECVVVDLSGVDYLDSVALGLLVLSQVNLSIKGIPLCLVGPQGGVREVLEISNIGQFIPVYQTVEEAIGSAVAV
ncbi:MAG: STAS domain-containing protein [Nitrospirae bacterium]|nr:STAS domain-containing protein [Nitrospirota bacterium]